MLIFTLKVLLFCWLINFYSTECANRPIIGVLVQELKPRDVFFEDKNITGIITASYVKAIESSGAGVVPIFNQKNDTYYKWIMESINGILLPGGHAEIKPGHGYYEASKKILKIAQKLYHKGIFFPVFGVCLGFETMLVIYNNDTKTDLLQRCDSIYESYPLELQSNHTESLLFSKLDRDTIHNLKSLPITLNSHKYCVFPRTFVESNLSKEWKITSLSTTHKGMKFISSIEHEKYPFVGVQFHPEMVAYNWAELNIPHDRRTIRTNRFFYDRLVDVSMSNGNKFENSEQERSALIYNYNPVYFRDKTHHYYMEKYYFNE